MFTVYRLVDQRGDAVRYIGITDNVYKRFSQHLRCDENNIDKNEWIHDLKIHHIMLLMVTIETVDTIEEAREREQHWIHHYLLQGARLLNLDISSSFTYEKFSSFFQDEKKPAQKKVVHRPIVTSLPVDLATRRRPFTTKEAVSLFGVTEKSIRTWKRSGELETTADGKFITASSVREMLKSRVKVG